MTLQTIGSDVEVFAKNKQGEHVALCGLIGGSKEEPLQIKDMLRGFMVQEDNVSLEFNIPVTDSKMYFVRYIKAMRDKSASIIKSLGFDMSNEASVSFGATQLTHPNALVFGCEPDYNIWSLKENEKPNAEDKNLRTAGGHIHVGTQRDMVEGVRYMDLFLGVPSVILDDKPSSIERRKLYGKSGAMRPKPYGFEYRVLSNFWIFDDNLISWVYNNTALAMDSSIKFDGDKVQQCINTGDKELAWELIKQYNIPMPQSNKPVVEEDVPF